MPTRTKQPPKRMSARQYLQHLWYRVKNSFLFVSIASLIWLLLRSGTKPSRIAYPCQRAAAANVGAFVGTLPWLLGADFCRSWLRHFTKGRAIAAFLLLAAFVSFGGIKTFLARLAIAKSWAAYHDKAAGGPFGKRQWAQGSGNSGSDP